MNLNTNTNRPLDGQTIPGVAENYVIGSQTAGPAFEYFEVIKPASQALFDAYTKNNSFKMPSLSTLIETVKHVLHNLPSAAPISAKIAQLNTVSHTRSTLHSYNLSVPEILASAYRIDRNGTLVLNHFNTFLHNMKNGPPANHSTPTFITNTFTYDNNVIKLYSYSPSQQAQQQQQQIRGLDPMIINFQDVPAPELIDHLLLQYILWFDFPYEIPSLNDPNIKTAYDQEGYESCTANASSFLYHYAEVVENNYYIFMPSRMYVWFNAIYMGDSTNPPRATTLYGNGGTSTTRAVLSTLKTNYGVCRDITYPYNGNAKSGSGGIKPVYDTEGKLAVSLAVTSVGHSVEDIKAVLLTQQRPLSMAFNVYNSGFYDGSAGQNGELHLPVIVATDGEGNITDTKIAYNFTYTITNPDQTTTQKNDIAGSHAVVIVGFNDNIRFKKLNYTTGSNQSDSSDPYYQGTYAGWSDGTHVSGTDDSDYEPYTGAFMVRNSWGQWGGTGVEFNGNAGYFWMPYAFFNGTNPENSSDNTGTTGEFLFLDPSVAGNRGRSITNPCQSCYTTAPCGFTFC